MGNPLLQRRSARDWAESSQLIEIAEKVGFFDGLAAVVGDDLSALDPDRMPHDWRERPVAGRLEFGFADTTGQVATVEGCAKTVVDAVCQRCLEPFSLTLEVEPKLLLLKADETVAGFDEYEVWELDEQNIRPADVIDELLVMAMPFSAMHDDARQCRALESTDESAGEETTRPFASLKAQMQRDTKDSRKGESNGE